MAAVAAVQVSPTKNTDIGIIEYSQINELPKFGQKPGRMLESLFKEFFDF